MVNNLNNLNSEDYRSYAAMYITVRHMVDLLALNLEAAKQKEIDLESLNTFSNGLSRKPLKTAFSPDPDRRSDDNPSLYRLIMS
uniref:Uncharacterized protein n=1 Tax=Romanomermis culicivorax TaxID=13658 RepID=A0A915KYW0_ROMCU